MMDNMATYRISVIIPVYNEGPQIYKNIMTVDKILSTAGIAHDFVLIDDGSKDNSWSEIQRLGAVLGCINAIRLSRNYGKEAALMAGIDAVTGDACVVMDADLQHPPELIQSMVSIWRNEGIQVVEAVKSSRGHESMASRMAANLFYKIMGNMTGIAMQNASDFKLLDRIVYQAIKTMPERETFFRGLSAWVGFRRKSIEFDVKDRMEGTSHWSLKSLVKLAIIAITSFSSAPLQFVTFIGTVFFFISVAMSIQTLYNKVFGHAVDGFTTVILLLLIIGSILMISLGLIGTYLARIYNEIKQRPRYVVSERLLTTDDKTNRSPDSNVILK